MAGQAETYSANTETEVEDRWHKANCKVKSLQSNRMLQYNITNQKVSVSAFYNTE
jgi:hypothetical protein